MEKVVMLLNSYIYIYINMNINISFGDSLVSRIPMPRNIYSATEVSLDGHVQKSTKFPRGATTPALHYIAQAICRRWSLKKNTSCSLHIIPHISNNIFIIPRISFHRRWLLKKFLIFTETTTIFFPSNIRKCLVYHVSNVYINRHTFKRLLKKNTG